MTKNRQGKKKFRGLLPLLGVSVILTLLAQFSFIGNSFSALTSPADQSVSGSASGGSINLSPGATGNIPGEGDALNKFILPVSPITPQNIKTKSITSTSEKTKNSGQDMALQAKTEALNEKQLVLEAMQQRLKLDITELKELKASVETLKEKHSETIALRWQDIVSLYEFMAPRAAASIFDGLEPLVLYEVVSRMNPRKAALILAYMNPKKAQQVTEMLAHPDAMQAYIASLPSNNAFLSRF